ncbi:MAG TPA: DUF1844 domain-containing protein [Thermoanaerobaculia bacterium]|nr:DUF1844 domain-containing protein [Thermoanaerobaculia bacterium]
MATEDEKPIRIVDRRMFTAEGDLRPDYEPEEAPEPARQPPPPRPASPPKTAPPPAPPQTAAAEVDPDAQAEPGDRELAEPRTDFASLIRSLATTAYSSLGLLPDPSGARRRDLAVARQMIEWLAVLEQKTRGNISFEESDFLSKILYELRLAYVEMTRPGAEPRGR